MMRDTETDKRETEIEAETDRWRVRKIETDGERKTVTAGERQR